MKLSLFKKLIREVIREELDYKFAELNKKLDEGIVKNNIKYIGEDKAYTGQDTDLKTLMNPTPPVKKQSTNVPVPKTNNKVLDELLSETAQGDEWKSIQREGGPAVESVVDNTEGLPDHLADAFNKNYSEVMKKVDEKAKFKNGQ
tara:strand:- start:232 stop:666 length:435 start_codon:yes stop_codon:yes gene_type:complete